MDHPTSSVGLVTIATLLLAGCAPEQPAVEQYGAMREVLREGRTEPRIAVVDAVADPGAVGVGALAGLGGEITIIDGDAWIARVGDGGLDVTGPGTVSDDQATLLTLSRVERWQTVVIDRAVDGADLESFIETAASAHGLDTTTPFPFVIEGELTVVDLHVINGYCPVATDPATVGAEPWRWSSPVAIEGQIVGFFAPDAAGVMTHHGTAIHAHAILSLDGATVTGHADRVAVGRGATLRLPRP